MDDMLLQRLSSTVPGATTSPPTPATVLLNFWSLVPLNKKKKNCWSLELSYQSTLNYNYFFERSTGEKISVYDVWVVVSTRDSAELVACCFRREPNSFGLLKLVDSFLN